MGSRKEYIRLAYKSSNIARKDKRLFNEIGEIFDSIDGAIDTARMCMNREKDDANV